MLKKRIMQVVWLLPLLLMLLPFAGIHAESQPASSRAVYIIPVHQTIESGLQSFLERAFKEAHEASAQLIVLDINTLGGEITAAMEIGNLVRDSKIPTVAFIHGDAASAGTFIALNANEIVMSEGSVIGAAAIVDVSGREVDNAKLISYWVESMESAAKMRGRNPVIAAGMVDKNIEVDIPEAGRKFAAGQLVSLSFDDALKAGYSEHTANTLEEVLSYKNVQEAPRIFVEPSTAENLSRILTSPVAKTLLLLVGIAGVAIELFVPGFGLPGILGALGFGLYFFSHYIAGFAGIEEIVLFVLGIILLIIEVVVPGFGLFAAAGTISLISGVVMASYNTASGLKSLGIAVIPAIILIAIFIKIFKRKGVWKKFILSEEQKNEEGYTSSSVKDHLLGKNGVALTVLRPSGTALIGEERIDVVTFGDYIDKGRKIKVTQIEGTRVVVRELNEDEIG
ncbi:nodulation protein NfeD [Paenibacillus sp. 32O-W]|uniref:NfeD family protein n=1 Tax=Paenibacillus sp. 32O-W TaxID=1695218 RepID=UPI0011A56307|nr:nodulation protein NfeD [Paenibacillus sp. 32O-W]